MKLLLDECVPRVLCVVHVRNNHYDVVRPFVPQIEEALARIQPRELILIN